MTTPASLDLRRRTLATRAALALVASCGLALAGCDRGDATASAIDTAKTKLGTVTSGGRVLDATVKTRRATYDEVVKLLQPHLGAAIPGQASAANGLYARAKGGLGDMKMREALDGQLAVANTIVEVRGALNVYQVQCSRADALEKFNPEKALKDLDNSLRANEASTKKAQDQKKDAQARVAALDAQAEGLLKQSQGLRDQVVQLKARAQSVSATEGLPLVQQASSVSRQADGLDKQASYVKADAAGIAPLVEAAERRLAQLADEAKQLTASRQEVTKRAEAYAAQAKEARGLADGASKDIASLAGKLDQLTASSAEMASAFEGAAKEYRDAVSKANVVKKNAGAEGKVSSSVQVAGYQQSLGDVLFARARVLQDIQTVYASLGSTKPALPDAARFDASAKAAGEEFAKVIKEAIETYTAAKDGFAGAGGNEAIRAKLDKLAELVGSIASKADGAIKPAAPAEAAPAEPAPAQSATDGAAAAPAGEGAKMDSDAVKPGDDAQVAAVRQMFVGERAARRTGDLAKVLEYYIDPTEQTRELLGFDLAMRKGLGELNAACTEKFSKPVAEALKDGGPMGVALAQMAAQAEPAINTLDLTTTTPEEVAWNIPGVGETKVMLRDGRWRIGSIQVPEGMAAQIKTMGPMLAQAYARVAAAVRGGSIPDAKALALALQKELTPGAPGAAGSPDMNK